MMGAIYTMALTFQMLMVYSFGVVTMPANVNMVMNKIYTMAQFDYLPSEKIMQFCFNFSKATMPLVAFEQFGYQSARLTMFLGSFLIAGVGVCLLSILYVLNLPFTNKFKLSFRFARMMKKTYFWNGIIVLLVQSYFDICLGVMLSW